MTVSAQLRQFLPGSQQFHELWLTGDYNGDPISVEFGAGVGLTPASDDLTVKLMFMSESGRVPARRCSPARRRIIAVQQQRSRKLMLRRSPALMPADRCARMRAHNLRYRQVVRQAHIMAPVADTQIKPVMVPILRP